MTTVGEEGARDCVRANAHCNLLISLVNVLCHHVTRFRPLGADAYPIIHLVFYGACLQIARKQAYLGNFSTKA
jgi:hypothetical protein